MKQKAILIALFLMVVVPSVAETAHWWDLTKYKPSETSIQGIPVEKINPSWSKVLVLNRQNCCQGYENGLKELEEDAGPLLSAFVWTGDLNEDGKADKVLVGIYEDKAGQLGSFLLVLTKDKKRWNKVFLEQVPDNPHFTLLTPFTFEDEGEQKLGIFWSFELYTHVDCSLVWENGEYKLKINDYAGPEE